MKKTWINPETVLALRRAFADNSRKIPRLPRFSVRNFPVVVIMRGKGEKKK